MKLKFRIVLALLVSIALGYTACKKSSDTPTASTVAPKTVVSEVALNLVATLNGGFGSFDASSGLEAPQKFVQNRFKGRKIDDIGDDELCGLVVDTTFKAVTVTDGANSATVSGSESFSLGCTNGVFSTITTVDNLTVSETTAQLTGTFKIAENLTLATLNPAADTSNFSLNGTLGYSGSVNYLTGSKQSGTSTFDYTLKSVIFDSQTGGIISGSATFDTKGTGSTGTWSYSGTITFLGNGNATITINGTSYAVDLTTGTVS